MADLDEIAIKAEIDQISNKIDEIMKKVDQLYPPQQKPTEQENASSQEKPLTHPGQPG